MEPKKRVLVVDDLLVDRLILERILEDEYVVLQAANGEEALSILKDSIDQANEDQGPIAGVILDLVMPVMDGYSVLEEMSSNESYRNIPIIVSTGDSDNANELRALKLGAWDFVSKPYDPTILKFRLRNVIERSQLFLLEQLQYVTDFDSLTDIYRKPKFFIETHRMIKRNPNKKFALIRFDIDRFQLINSFFGHDEGDNLLRFIAESLKGYESEFDNITYGRIDSDVFVVCIQYTTRGDVFDFIAKEEALVRSFKQSFDVIAVFGIYFIEDTSLAISTMLDRATLAAKTCKGNYAKPFAEYDPTMSKRLENEQEILNEIHRALDEHQFIVYYQAKYDLATKKPVGAEALARWMQPEKGLVPPSVFIPVCEKNGLVSEVDHCIWEEVCKQLRTWIDKGITPLPISVNMSRVNLYNPNIVQEVCDIAKKYEIDHGLLQIEMTESTYMDNPEIMKRVVNGFHAEGFAVHMDDFGAGYSSLSILKDIDVDLLKIDMRFLSRSDFSGRGESILASVVRMAKWLGIPTITEGVEELHQVDFLKSVGCEFAQGFYFTKPIPADEFEELIGSANVMPNSKEGSHKTNVTELWTNRPDLEKMFTQDAAPFCIIEANGEIVDIIRANEAFCNLVGSRDTLFSERFLRSFKESSRYDISEALKQTTLKKGSVPCKVKTSNENEATLYFTSVGNISSTWVIACATEEIDFNN